MNLSDEILAHITTTKSSITDDLIYSSLRNQYPSIALNSINYGVPKIDSLNIDIPADRVTQLSDCRIGKLIIELNPITGEVYEVRNKETNQRKLEELAYKQILSKKNQEAIINPSQIKRIETRDSKHENGIQIHLLRNRNKRMGNSSSDVYNITVNAKQCGSAYFNGLTDETIKIAYDSIIGFGLIHFSFEDFIQGAAFSVDIAIDIKGNKDNLIRLKDALNTGNRLTELGRKSNSFIGRKKNSSSSTGEGFDFKPKDDIYLKIYDKTLELATLNTKLFTDTFLMHHIEAINNGILRVEMRIENQRDRDRLGITSGFKTLNDWLNASTDKLLELVKKGISRYIILEKATMNKDEKKRDSGKGYTELALFAMNPKATVEEILNLKVDLLRKLGKEVTRKQKCAYKSEIQCGYDMYKELMKKESEAQNNELDSLLKSLGIYTADTDLEAV